MADNPDFAALEKNAPQFKPPSFDNEISQIYLAAGGGFPIKAGVLDLIKGRLQAAFMDGVITALKDRARAQGIAFPDDVRGGPLGPRE